MKSIKLLLFPFILLLVSGCATRGVWFLGVEKSEIVFDKEIDYSFSTNRDIAIKVKEKIGYFLGSATAYDKYLIIPSEVIFNQINNYTPPTVNQYTPPASNIKKIKPIWHAKIVPPPFVERSASRKELVGFEDSGTFSLLFTDSKNDCIPFEYHQDVYYICPDRPGSRIWLESHGWEQETKTLWWGYPIRVLFIVPAVAFDLVTSPIQFAYLSREARRSYGAN